MKRLNRKETRFIALILAVCMIIGILYINDREKVALAGPETISWDMSSDTVSIPGEGEDAVNRNLYFATAAEVTLPVLVAPHDTEGEFGPSYPTKNEYVWLTSAPSGDSDVTGVTKINSSTTGVTASLYIKSKKYAIYTDADNVNHAPNDTVGYKETYEYSYTPQKYSITAKQIFDKDNFVSDQGTVENKEFIVTSTPPSDAFENTGDYYGTLKFCIKEVATGTGRIQEVGPTTDAEYETMCTSNWDSLETILGNANSTTDPATDDHLKDGKWTVYGYYKCGTTFIKFSKDLYRYRHAIQITKVEVLDYDSGEVVTQTKEGVTLNPSLTTNPIEVSTARNDKFKIRFTTDRKVDVYSGDATSPMTDGEDVATFTYTYAGTAPLDVNGINQVFKFKDPTNANELHAERTVKVSFVDGKPVINSFSVSSSSGKKVGDTYYTNNIDTGLSFNAEILTNKPVKLTGLQTTATVGSTDYTRDILDSTITPTEYSEDTTKWSYSCSGKALALKSGDEGLTPNSQATVILKAISSTSQYAETTPSLTVVYDTTEPTIDTVYDQVYLSQNGNKGNIAAGGSASQNVTALQDYYLTFDPGDNLAGIDPDTLSVTAEGLTIEKDSTYTGSGYRYKVTAPGLSKSAGSDTITVSLSDYAGNVKTGTFTVTYMDETMAISSTIKDTSGTATFPSEKDEFNVEFTVTTKQLLDITDPTDPLAFTFADAATKGVTYKYVDSETVVPTDVDEYGNYVYKYVYKLTFSKSAEVGGSSESPIKVTAVNKNGRPFSYNVAIIRVDLQNPTTSVAEEKGGTLGTTDSNGHTWYQNVILRVTCSDAPEEGGTYKSGIKTITLSDNGTDNDYSSNKESTIRHEVSESKSTLGTDIKISVEDNVGRQATVYSKTFYVDQHNPKASLTVNGLTPDAIKGKSLDGVPTIAYKGSDNLKLAYYQINVKKPDGTTKTEKVTEVREFDKSPSLSDFIGEAAADGAYAVSLTAVDFAGRIIDEGTISTDFILDNTKPINDVIITTAKPAKFEKYHSSYSNPESGVSYEYGQYYAGKVSVDLQVIDNDLDTSDIVVTDNGDKVNVSWSAATINGKAGYKASYSTSSEGSHTITIAATDKAGLKSTAKAVTYNVDNTAPTITASLNGSAISGGSGVRYLNVNGNVVVTANDKYFDEDDFTRVVKRTTPDKAVNNDTSNISNGSTPYTTDADYEITYKVVDRAGRETTLGPIEFRVDKVAPKLEVTGAASGGTARTNVSASMIITEDFYWDMTSVTCKIYKKVDGQGERLFEDVKVNPTSARTAINRALAEDGEYRFEMEATDKCGNHTTYTYSFIVDANAPLIELSGVKNYDSTDKAVDLIVKVTENFYTTNKLSISGTRTDINGDVEKLNLTGYNVNAAKVTTIPQQFKEDGIYDINVRSVDKAGNEDNKKVHFTIDSKAPIIKSLPEYDGTLFSEFKWDEDPDDLVTDLTVCQVTILMDGVEYDGLTELSDGSHTLRIEAVDELGHESSAEYTFLVDTKPPTILVTGVENGEVILEERNIDISLQLDEDMLRSVTLNGKAISVANNTAKLTINEKGTYTLKVEAVDKAGNVSTIEYTFTFGKTANWWWLIILIAAILLLLIIFFIIYKNRWNQKN